MAQPSAGPTEQPGAGQPQPRAQSPAGRLGELGTSPAVQLSSRTQEWLSLVQAAWPGQQPSLAHRDLFQ